MGVVVRVTRSFWSSIERETIYRTNMNPEVNYYLFDEFWYSWSIVPDFGRILVTAVSGNFSLQHLWDGYYFIFLFQILTVLFLSVCLVAQKWEQYFPVIAQVAIIVVTLLVSVAAPIIGVSQYVQTWSFAGGREFVQFEAGFYLAVVSSILTLFYAATYFVKVLRKRARFASFWKEESLIIIRMFCFFSEKKGLSNLNGSGSGEGRWVGLRCLPLGGN